VRKEHDLIGSVSFTAFGIKVVSGTGVLLM